MRSCKASPSLRPPPPQPPRSMTRRSSTRSCKASPSLPPPPPPPPPQPPRSVTRRSSMRSRHDKEKAVNVQVLLRCRPFSEDELRAAAPHVVTCNEYQREVGVSHHVAGRAIDRVFTFDKVFGPSAQQEDLYSQSILPIVNEVLQGFNCTIFAYGQTGTGKTFTMEGEGDLGRCKGELPINAGIIPRAIKQIFDTLESQHAEYNVKVSFLDLCNEEITDLLAPGEKSKASVSVDKKRKKCLLLMEDGKGDVLVPGLEEEIVNNAGEMFTLIERGSARRPTSRSHSLFSITIHIKEAAPEGEELIKCGKLNLVDLAGSKNISRSHARENRAREAGEINKSLLTLGRVITALAEHQGHVPHRDSKLTRLLRDSLGGRTKTCIIATISPSVHCLDETLSTLDYAHRAKKIKNRPEVNRKVMKSTPIKDLYGEIERLKTDLDVSCEKVGVYIPKDRYYQEELEIKSMAEQIEKKKVMLENNQKKIEELQGKYISELQNSSDLRKILSSTEESLEHTSTLLVTARKELMQSQHALGEKDFVISEQMKLENSLIHEAFVLRIDLMKALHDNASLFKKIATKDHLANTNRKVINDFQAEATSKIGSLCNTVVSSIMKEKYGLQKIEELCKSSLAFQDKSFLQLKEQVSVARIEFLSHLESLQNAIHLQKVGWNGSLEEIFSTTDTNFKSLENLLAVGEDTVDKILGDLRDKLSSHWCDIADFSRESREMFGSKWLLDKDGNESLNLQSLASQTHDAWKQMAGNFQEEYEERSMHCNAVVLLNNVNTVDPASKHCKDVDQSIRKLSEHLMGVDATVKNVAEANNQHDFEIVSTCTGVQGDFSKNNDCLLQKIEGTLENHNKSISEIMGAIENHLSILTELGEEHAALAKDFNHFTENTFQQSFKEYEPSGCTPVRPEYRENYSYVPPKESKPLRIPPIFFR